VIDALADRLEAEKLRCRWRDAGGYEGTDQEPARAHGHEQAGPTVLGHLRHPR
jgi:hypothetical protein